MERERSNYAVGIANYAAAVINHQIGEEAYVEPGDKWGTEIGIGNQYAVLPYPEIRENSDTRQHHPTTPIAIIGKSHMQSFRSHTRKIQRLIPKIAMNCLLLCCLALSCVCSGVNAFCGRYSCRNRVLLHKASVTILPAPYRLCTSDLIRMRVESSASEVNEILTSSLDKELSQKLTSLPRLYVGHVPSASILPHPSATVPLAKSSIVKLTPDQSHYLTKVMRFLRKSPKKRSIVGSAQDGIDMTNCIRIFDGTCGEWLARVGVSSDNQAEDNIQGNRGKRKRKQKLVEELYAECLLPMRDQSDNVPGPWVLFAPIKKQRAKLLIEKCTELGAGLFAPVLSERTESGSVSGCLGSATASDNSLEKLAFQAREAAEQSERLTVPCVVPCLSDVEASANVNLWDVKELLKQWGTTEASGKGRILMVCRERGTGSSIPIMTALENNARHSMDSAKVAFFIGPEGGWSPEEEQLFDSYASESPQSVMNVSLGGSVLRAETAAIISIGAWALQSGH